MVRQKALGTEGLLTGLILVGAMSALNFFNGTTEALGGDMGICMPSPNLWVIPPLWSWIANLTMIVALAITLHLFNKSYQFIKSTDSVLPTAFLIMVGSCPWITLGINTSMLLVMVNIIALIVLFDCYRTRNATQQIFVVATMASLGSMFQYAFVFMLPAYIVIAVMMKCFRFREFIALLMGLVAPYWVGIGLGLIPLDSFTLPTLSNLFAGFATKQDLLIGLLNIGLTAIVALFIALNSAVKLYAGNTQRRLYHNSVMVLGIVTMVALAFDFNNLTAYIGTIYMVAAVEYANLFALWHIRKADRWMFFIGMVYVTFFCLMHFGPETFFK